MLAWFDTESKKYEEDLIEWTSYDEEITKQNLKIMGENSDYPNRIKHLWEASTPFSGYYINNSGVVDKKVKDINYAYTEEMSGRIEAAETVSEINAIEGSDDYQRMGEYLESTQEVMKDVLEKRRAEIEVGVEETTEETEITEADNLMAMGLGLKKLEVERDKLTTASAREMLDDYIEERRSRYIAFVDAIREAETGAELNGLEGALDSAILGEKNVRVLSGMIDARRDMIG